MLSKEGKENSKQIYKKKGVTYLLIAIALIVLSIIMNSSGIQGGLIIAFISLALVVFLISSIFYFVKGFFGKS